MFYLVLFYIVSHMLALVTLAASGETFERYHASLTLKQKTILHCLGVVVVPLIYVMGLVVLMLVILVCECGGRLLRYLGNLLKKI